MMRSQIDIIQNERGASAVEFAIAVPVLLILIIGIIQLGILFMANAGLQQAVEEGARYATIYPSPDSSAIIARVNDRRFGLDAANVTGPSVTPGTTSDGINYVDVTMSYSAPLNFVFFETDPVTLSHTRRAYQP
jgi:Flp pilus assembly protein TadG